LYNKKGMDMRIIVTAIIVIIAAGILLYGTKLLADIGKDSVDREACRDSVLLKARTKLLGNPIAGDIHCKTNTIEIDAKDSYESNSIIANEMYDCWYQFVEGDADFLDDHDWGKGDNWCFVCSRIEFSDETQKDVSQINGLFDFLRTEPLPFTGQKTYFEYIYKDASNDVAPQNFGETFDTSKPVYVVFFGDKRFEWVSGDTQDILTIAGQTLGTLWAGAKIGGLWGSKGGLWGVVIGTVGGIVYNKASVKTGYVSGLYVGSDDTVIQRCRQ